MAKRGPKDKPTSIKELQGNPGKRPINRREPSAEVGPLLPPPMLSLSDGAKELWDYLVPILAQAGLFTVLDIMAVSRYCEIWAEWQRAKGHMVAKGLGAPKIETYFAMDGKKKVEKKRLVGFVTFPQTRLYSALDSALSRKESEFGLNPSARATVRALQPTGPGQSKPQSIHDAIDDILDLDGDEDDLDGLDA